MTTRVKCAVVGLLCLLLVGSGCAATPTAALFQGNPVDSQQVVAMQTGGPHGGTFENFDIRIEYRHTLDGAVFELAGGATLGAHYQMMYDRIRDLRIYLFFVDSDARVLETASLVWAAVGSTSQPLGFSRFLKVPEGAAGFAFGYDGKVSEWEGSVSFYLLPLRR